MTLNYEKIDYDEIRNLEAQLKELDCHINSSADRRINKYWFNALEYRNEDFSICINYGLGKGCYREENERTFKVSENAKIEDIAKATNNMKKAMKLINEFVKGKEM